MGVGTLRIDLSRATATGDECSGGAAALGRLALGRLDVEAKSRKRIALRIRVVSDHYHATISNGAHRTARVVSVS